MKPPPVDNGSWTFAEELLERGDPLFVRELRRITDADRLGAFAPRWYADRRPAARRFLLDYLDEPLNAYRHEALVKRLFKLAEKSGDDEVMARFLVLFDRSVRRVVGRRYRSQTRAVSSDAEADAVAAAWRAAGTTVYFQGTSASWGGRAITSTNRADLSRIRLVMRHWTEDALVMPPGMTMPRPARLFHARRVPFGAPAEQLRGKVRTGPSPLLDDLRAVYEQRRLFSVATRRYLQRRAWRYFRGLGKKQPERYVAAIARALVCYRDEDVPDGAALLDNWGLMHALFHHSPVVAAEKRGWQPAPGRSLAELEPAPIFEPLWREAPGVLVRLVREARCRPVRQWAVRLVRRDHDAVLRALPPDELVAWLGHADPEVASLAAELLRALPDLSPLGAGRLVGLLDEPHPETVEIVCGLLADRLKPESVSLEQAARLAAARPLPVARLGFAWLRTKTPSGPDECALLLGLVEAESEPLRPEIVRWLRGVLGASPEFRPAWVLEYLDSRHADVRAEGWAWLESDPRVSGDVDLWQRLLESPYDDVRLRLVAALEERVARGAPRPERGRLDPELVRFRWASVLLNVRRGGRSKPAVVGQVVRRLGEHPAEADVLLPVLAAALRSVRGPEWRAGLAGVVRAAEQDPELRALVERTFPELKLG